jgi:hypothetical protein
MSAAPAHVRTTDPSTGGPRTLCGAAIEGGMVLVTDGTEATSLGLELCELCARAERREPAAR